METYLDHNVIVDLVSKRKNYSLTTIASKKKEGYIFPYSPFHLEEVAVILLKELAEHDQIQYINRDLYVLRTVSDLWEYVPGGEGPIQRIQEDPLTSLKDRVLKDYWITAECNDLEEMLDSQRSQRHFEAYSNKLGIEPKGHIRSRETIRAELNINLSELSQIIPSQGFADTRVLKLLSQKLPNYGLTIENIPRGAAIRKNHDLTRKTVDCLMRVLNEAGFYADPSGKHRSYMFDVGHTIYATRATRFVVGDVRLSKRAKAIFSFLDAETQVISPEEFFKNPGSQ